MSIDLLFHITSQDQWRNYSTNGYIEPDSLQEEGFIHTSKGDQVEETANRLFSGEENILLLVIDPLRIQEPLKYETAENGLKYPHIYGKISIDAVIDKIPISPDKSGKYNVKVRHFD